jgi:hypothetical protein
LAVADQNSLNTLHFTAANSQLYALANAMLGGSSAGSIYLVYKAANTAVALVDYGSGVTGSWWPYSDNNLYVTFGSTSRYNAIPTASPTAGYRIISVYSALNDWALYVDGGTGGSSGGTSPLMSSGTNTVGWNASPQLGFSSLTGAYLNGWIAEIYFTNAKQSTADRQSNEGYLAWKWGLQGNLDPSHPYKAFSPTNTPQLMKIGDMVVNGTNKSVLFVGPGGLLAQDANHFTFDPATNYLDVGMTGNVGAYYLNNIPAIYVVPNASGDNWFEGDAGNLGVTGFNNFGTGGGCVQSVTTGTNNTGMGFVALQNMTTGTDNFAFGSGALQSSVLDSFNVAIGRSACQALGIGGAGSGNNAGNTVLGYNALSQIQQGYKNTVVGNEALAGMAGAATSVGNVCFGANAGQSIGVGSSGLVQSNIMIGDHAGYHLTGSTNYNTWIGGYQGTASSPQYTFCASVDVYPVFSWNITSPNVFSTHNLTNPQAVHVYNTIDNIMAPANWECGVLDWITTSNVFRIGYQSGGTGALSRLIAIDGFQKAGAPAAGDLPSGTCALINDTSGGQTWLCYNAAGTIRKVQLT